MTDGMLARERKEEWAFPAEEVRRLLASEVLSELDAEFDAPACGRCGAAMNRRGTRAAAPLSLLGPLSLAALWALVELATETSFAKAAARSSSCRRIADRRSRASAGRSASSTLKLRYDRVRIDSIFMVRVSIQWVCVH